MSRNENLTREAALHTLRNLFDNFITRCEEHYDPNEMLQWVEDLLKLRTETYFIGSDGNEHLFVVPVAKREEWRRWCSGQETADPAFPTAPPPAWATYINGPANVIEFYWDGVVRR